MNDYCEKTIQYLATRSSNAVVGCAMLFALVGGLLPMFRGTSSWAVIWMPLCFLVIPPVHFLSRELLLQRQRIIELERQLAER